MASAPTASRVTTLELATKLSPARVRFFHYLSERCVSLGVRGPFSAEVLDKIGVRNVELVGCPSYFETGPDRIVAPALSPEGRARIATTGAFRTHLPAPLTMLQGDVEWPLIELMHQLDGPIASTSIDGIAAAREDRLLLADVCEDRVHFVTDPETWKRRIRETCLLAVGTRLHGAIAALNAGVPAIVLNIDARAQETCELFGIPWLPHKCDSGTSLAMLCEMADVDRLNTLYPARYTHFADWMARLGLPLFHALPSRLPSSDLPRVPEAMIKARVAQVRARGLEVETQRALGGGTPGDDEGVQPCGSGPSS